MGRRRKLSPPITIDQQQEIDPTVERMWQVINQIRERNADKDRDEEMAFINEVVEEVRRERCVRSQRNMAQSTH